MKTTRIIISLFLMLFTLGVSAQDSYRETFKGYMKVNPNLQGFSSDKMRTALQGINSLLLQDMEEDEANKLTNRYLDEQFMDDMIDLLLPTMKEHLTESDLKEMITILSTPEALSYTSHNLEWTDAFTESVSEPILEASKAVSSGKTPAPINIASNINKQYAEKFTLFANESDLKSQFKKGLEVGAGQLPEELTTWINNNLTNMMINSSYGIFTEKDIDFGINLFKTPLFKKTLNATNALLDDPMAIGLSFITNYQKWLKKQGVEVSDLPF